ncbi:MAG: hypothetical protein ACRCXZ_02795 [Patescibacteria group bacterium]
MNNLGTRFYILLLELSKNLRYWVMFLPILTILLLTPIYYLTTLAYSSTLSNKSGSFNIASLNKLNVPINIDQESYQDLKNGKRLFYSRINNRENDKYGFRKLIYQIEFLDENNNIIEKDDTKYETFMLPKKTFYLSHFGTIKAKKMKLKFLMNESDSVYVLPSDISKADNILLQTSNLNLDSSSDEFFNINFLLNNRTNKTLNNLIFQFIIKNKAGENAYIGNISISQLTDLDNTTKSVNQLSYPLNQSKNELEFTVDNVDIRYNYLLYGF